jgi:hypothetical protein
MTRQRLLISFPHTIAWPDNRPLPGGELAQQARIKGTNVARPPRTILYIQRSSDSAVTVPVGIHYDSISDPMLKQGGQSDYRVPSTVVNGRTQMLYWGISFL